MAEAASDREVRVGQGELRGLLQIKVRGSCDQGQIVVEETKRQIQRNQEETKREMVY